MGPWLLVRTPGKRKSWQVLVSFFLYARCSLSSGQEFSMQWEKRSSARENVIPWSTRLRSSRKEDCVCLAAIVFKSQHCGSPPDGAQVADPTASQKIGVQGLNILEAN